MHRLLGQERRGGQVLVLFAVVIMLLAAICVLTIDVGRLFTCKAQLQSAVDAAALAGASQLLGIVTEDEKALALAEATAPGQFAMVRVRDEWDPYLRYALPLHRPSPASVGLYVTTGEPAYRWLSALRIGDTLDLVGPCGRAAPPPHPGANVGLLSQGTSIASLLGLLDAGTGGVQLVTSVPTARQAYPSELLPARVAHSSFVGRGQDDAFWRAAREVVRWAEAVYTAGSEPFYRRLRDTIERERVVTREGFAQAWAWRDMACGTGACEGCLTPTRRGPRRACTEGPFFDLSELIID